MNSQKFTEKDLKRLFRPQVGAPKGRNGQVTIIGGSSLFHGAPILALKVASRIVDMVYFATPQASVGKVAEKLKSQLCSFIWVPWEETEEYIKKSDAVLIGPGMMRTEGARPPIPSPSEESLRATSEVFPWRPRLSSPPPSEVSLGKLAKTTNEGIKTGFITGYLLKKYPQKRWVIDAGSLQMMEADWIPKGAILTPNQKEFEMLFGMPASLEAGKALAKNYKCFIILKSTSKGPQAIICSPEKAVVVKGGNAGLTKGGTGDVLAGLTVALAAKNEPFLAAKTAALVIKLAADELYKKVGFAYNADDLTEEIPIIMKEIYVSA